MGSLAILTRANQKSQHYAIFVQHEKCDPNFPLLLLKGKTKPMPNFNPKALRDAHTVSAATRIFYGDYESVAVRNLKKDLNISCKEVGNKVEEVIRIPFSDSEIEVVHGATSDEERSAIVCTSMVAHFYKLLGVLQGNPESITPANLEEHLDLETPIYIKLPGVKKGPLACGGDPPFLSKLV